MSRVEENDERSRTNNYKVIKELHRRIADLDDMLAEETRQLKEMTAQMEKTSLKKAIDLIMAQPPEPHYPAYFADLLREADVPDKNVGDLISRQKVRYKLTALVNEIEEIFANIREREVDDSVCGLCEYDGAYIGQSGDWCNECPGFDKDNCFKLKDKYRAKWESIDE